MNTFQEFVKTKAQIKELQGKLEQLEVDLYNQYSNDLKALTTGTFSKEEGDYKIKIVKKQTTTIDQNLAKALSNLHPDVFKVKYSIDKKTFESLPHQVQCQIEDCITTKPAKPSFSVELNHAN